MNSLIYELVINELTNIWTSNKWTTYWMNFSITMYGLSSFSFCQHMPLHIRDAAFPDTIEHRINSTSQGFQDYHMIRTSWISGLWLLLGEVGPVGKESTQLPPTLNLQNQ